MLEGKTMTDVKELGQLFKKLSVLQNNFVLFPSEETINKVPLTHYFEVIQQVFNNPTPLNAISN